MQRISNHISLLKQKAIGDKYFITLQKAAEAGVQDFREVAAAEIRKPEDGPLFCPTDIAQLSLIEPLDKWGLGGKSFKVDFRCIGVSDLFEQCGSQVNESLVCPECKQAYYLSSNGLIYLLPTPTEE